MIELEVIQSPDREMIGTHLLYKKVLVLGHSHGDLLFQDPEVTDFHLKISLEQNGVVGLLNKNKEFFHVNGKRVTVERLIMPGDQFQIGGTLLSLKDFQMKPAQKKGDLINKNLTIVMEEASMEKIREVLELLEQDLRKLA